MKKVLPIVLVCLAAALAASTGPFFDREGTLRRTASGMASRHGLVDSGPVEKLYAFAWERGAWGATDLVRALEIAAPLFLVLLAAAFLVSRLPLKLRKPAEWLWGIGVASVFALGLWNGWAGRVAAVREPRLLAPLDLLDRARQLEGRIFFNPHALLHAALFADEKIEPGIGLEKVARLQSSPADWRAEDRKNPYSGIVFSGSDVRGGPFLEMVRSMPGWSLAMVDNHGLLFVRGTTEPESATLELAEEKFPDVENRALYLAQAAMVQQAIGQPRKARQLLGNAFEISESNPHVLVNSARLAAAEGRWSDTLEATDSVLKKNPRSIQARYLEALALFESGAISKAAVKANALAESFPEDATLLALQARIASQNNDPATETAALEKLVVIAKRQGQPVGDYHALLGQAWARRGYPEQALANYQAALDANPPPEIRVQIEEAMQVIRQRTR